MTKVHLKSPTKDGVVLIEGQRIFALTINSMPMIAKVAKGSSVTTSSNQLSSKIIAIASHIWNCMQFSTKLLKTVS